MAGDSFGLGIFASLTGGGANAMARRLDDMVKRGRNPAAAYRMLGHEAANLVQKGISQNVGGWPKPSAWPRGYRRGGHPLMDTRRLVGSIAYRSSASGMGVGSPLKQARALNRGAIIRPKGKYLLLPLNPPLTPSQVRAWPRGKAAIQAAYPGSIFLLHGPEGPGIYRPSRVRIATNIRSKSGATLAAPTARYRRGKAMGIERIAAAVKSTKVPAFGFLKWRVPWVSYLSQRYASWYVNEGKATA